MRYLGFLKFQSELRIISLSRLLSIGFLLVAGVTMTGCGGGRSGTNAGNDVKFTTVLEFNDPATQSPSQGVNVIAFDGRSFNSDDQGQVAIEFTSGEAPLTFDLGFQGRSGAIDLGIVENYEPQTNMGLLAEIEVSSDGSGATFNVTQVTVIPKEQPTATPDPIIETDSKIGEDSNSDKPKSEGPHQGPATPTPTPVPSPTPPAAPESATVSVMFTDSNDHPIPNLSVSIPGSGDGITTNAGRFVFEKATFRMIDRTLNEWGTHLRVFINNANYGVTVALPPGVTPESLEQLNVALRLDVSQSANVDGSAEVTLTVRATEVRLRPANIDLGDPNQDSSRDEIRESPLEDSTSSNDLSDRAPLRERKPKTGPQ